MACTRKTGFHPYTYIFPHPAPQRKRSRIYPVFIPFSGCPTKCVFCAQDLQTGKGLITVDRALIEAEQALERLARTPDYGMLELAFFGGTFTALPVDDLTACLKFAERWQRRGVVGTLRCSTRPDALSASLLSRLKNAGFACIELGIQSFDSHALSTSRRGYTREQALEACSAVGESGMSLCVQLMPGMPGMSAEAAYHDTMTTASFSPSAARLYPCLVLRNTLLAGLWQKGNYSPWPLNETITHLSRSCLTLWAAGCRVIRMGLAQEPGLEHAVLAGPCHPALGNRVRSNALFYYISDILSDLSIKHNLEREPPSTVYHLNVPRKSQGEFWGWQGEIEPLYHSLGLNRQAVTWWDEPHFALFW